MNLDERIFSLLNDYRQHRLTANSGTKEARKLISDVVEYIKPLELDTSARTFNKLMDKMEELAGDSHPNSKQYAEAQREIMSQSGIIIGHNRALRCMEDGQKELGL